MINRLNDSINKWIFESTPNQLVICVLFLWMIGMGFNHYNTHHYFYFNQLILLFMLITQICIVRLIKKERKIIELQIRDAQESEVLSVLKVKSEKILTSNYAHIICYILVTLYIITMFKLKCIESTITGIYGGFLGVVVFYVGIQAYMQYLALVYFTYDIRNVKIKNYSFYYPALTNWFGKLAQTFSFIEKCFLFLGILYSAVYAINLPNNSIIYNQGFRINTPNNTLFLITWCGILLLFVIACPMLSLLTRSFLKTVIRLMKTNSIKLIEQKIKIISNSSNADEVDIIDKKLKLIREVNESADYPLKISHTIFDSIYAFATASITLISPFLPMIEASIVKSNP